MLVCRSDRHVLASDSGRSAASARVAPQKFRRLGTRPPCCRTCRRGRSVAARLGFATRMCRRLYCGPGEQGHFHGKRPMNQQYPTQNEYITACVRAARAELAESCRREGWPVPCDLRRSAWVARQALYHYSLAVPRGESLWPPEHFIDHL